MNRARILSFGEVLWDLFPTGEKFGGAPANYACHAALLGGDVALVSAVGGDDHGQRALEILRRYNVDVSLVQETSVAATGAVGVSVDASGKPSFTIHPNAAWDQLAWSPALADRVAEADAVYFGTLGQREEPSRTTIRRGLEVAKEAGVMRVLDMNLRKPFFNAERIRSSIERASLLKLSDEELPVVSDACELSRGEPLTQLEELLSKYRLDLVVMTCGANGAMLVDSTGQYRQPGISTTVVDTVGAGDSFLAALTLGVLHGEARRGQFAAGM